nr:hypothetical protein [Paenibacillus bovis]
MFGKLLNLFKVPRHANEIPPFYEEHVDELIDDEDDIDDSFDFEEYQKEDFFY